MDIVLGNFNIFDIHGFISRRTGQQLHDTDGTGMAPFGLIQPGLLIALGGNGQPVESVTFRIFLKQRDESPQLFTFFGRGGIFDPFCILVIPFKKNVAQQRALLDRFGKGIQTRLELGIVFPHGPGDPAAGVNRQVLASDDIGKQLGPYVGNMVIGHRYIDHPGVHHFQNIFGS